MKVTSKHADATMAKLASVMNRNTTLATGNEPKAASPVATYTARPVLPPTTAFPRTTLSPNASGIRLKPNDHAKIREVIQAGLALQETLAVSDVLRIALAAYDPKRLSTDAIIAAK